MRPRNASLPVIVRCALGIRIANGQKLRGLNPEDLKRDALKRDALNRRGPRRDKLNRNAKLRSGRNREELTLSGANPSGRPRRALPRGAGHRRADQSAESRTVAILRRTSSRMTAMVAARWCRLKAWIARVKISCASLFLMRDWTQRGLTG